LGVVDRHCVQRGDRERVILDQALAGFSGQTGEGEAANSLAAKSGENQAGVGQEIHVLPGGVFEVKVAEVLAGGGEAPVVRGIQVSHHFRHTGGADDREFGSNKRHRKNLWWVDPSCAVAVEKKVAVKKKSRGEKKKFIG
jgi:hypothetical protein